MNLIPPCIDALPRRSRHSAATALLALVVATGVAVGAATVAAGEVRTPTELEDRQVVARIDELIRQGWEDNAVRPSRPADEAKWVRRVYLDLIGRIPTIEELDAVASLKPANWREALVERLLGPDYEGEYARHWTNIWTNLLIGRTGGTDGQSLTHRPGMRDYLEQSFLENKPYHRLVAELVTATGGARPEMEDYNPAVNFLVEKMDDGGVQATARTAQIFLGMAVQCTQCHNHPFNDYRQNQFWELDAFFRQTRTQVVRDEENDRMRLASLVDRDFAGEGRSIAGDQRREIYLELHDGQYVDRDLASANSAPIYYELRNGQLRAAFPVFVDGTSLEEVLEERGSELGNSGLANHVNRRRELAKLMLASPLLQRAIVNRLWGHFLGYGLTSPVDDMGPHNPPSHPQLLEELAEAMRASEFDMKRLMRWIVLSEPYSLSSQVSAGSAGDDPELGRPPLFARFYLRQMQAEQLYESLLAATQADAALKRDARNAARQRWLDQFNTAFGNDEGTEATTFNGSIPQALMMMNGELVRSAASVGKGSFLDQVAGDPSLTNRQKFQTLYRAALSRLPTSEEADACNHLMAAREGDVASTLQDIWWAVLNSNEFILVH